MTLAFPVLILAGFFIWGVSWDMIFLNIERRKRSGRNLRQGLEWWA